MIDFIGKEKIEIMSNNSRIQHQMKIMSVSSDISNFFMLNNKSFEENKVEDDSN